MMDSINIRGFLLLSALLVLAGCANHAPAQPAPSQSQSNAPQQTKAEQQPETESTHTDSTQSQNSQHLYGRNEAGFKRWVTSFRKQAHARGVSSATLNQAFNSARFQPRIIELDHRQPEFTQTIWGYLDNAASPTRIQHGHEKLRENQATADRITAQYGVPGPVIVAIWGIESNYGGNFGHFRTIDALATLGYDGRRESFARKQLYAALKILDAGDISYDQMRGSWAGAMGNTQFLPTSFLGYAVDADGDGRRDIWGSIPDTMASTANYLKKNGWKAGEPWGREIILPASFNYAEADGKTRHSTRVWQTRGVKAVDSRGLPQFSSAAIIAPAGASGPAFMVGPNFRTILRYNNATSYALAVGLLADQIAGQPGVQHSWPRDEASLSRHQILALQRNLNRLGYGTGTPDGIIGPNTEQGIRAFQSARNMPADGFATRSLLDQVKAAR